MSVLIAPWELVGRLGEEEVVVVDCRSQEEWTLLPVQIPGALWMPVEEIRASPWTLPDDELIVLYDGSTDGPRARAAQRILRHCGRRSVYLDGGLSAWLALGFPIESMRVRGRESVGVHG